MSTLTTRLRVMHIISGDLWAGAETQALTLLKHLHNTVSIHVVVMNNGELFKRLENLQIPVTLLPESELSTFYIFIKLTRLIRAFNPDLLHTHREKENILGSFANFLAALPLKKRARSVRTVHGAPEFLPKGKQKIQAALNNWTGRYLQEVIIAVSNELAEKLKLIYPAHKIRVIPNGVDRDELRAHASLADFRLLAPNHKHIGIIGRVERVKRIDIFIEMANMLLRNSGFAHSLKFHIIGDGGLRAIMEQTVKQLGLDDHIHFHGHRADIASCINSLDVIVMCSDHEGTPMVALEAMALGVPMVAHKTGGLSDILEEYPELLVCNHNAQSYAKLVLDAIERRPMVELNMRYISTANAHAINALYGHLTN